MLCLPGLQSCLTPMLSQVKIERSYPGECLTRHPENGAAPAPAAPDAKKKKKAPAPPPPAPTKTETAKDTMKSQPVNDDTGEDTRTRALSRFRKAVQTVRPLTLLELFVTGTVRVQVALRLRLVKAFSSALGAPAANSVGRHGHAALSCSDAVFHCVFS